MHKRIPRSVMYACAIIVGAALVVTATMLVLQSRRDNLRDRRIQTAAKNIYATASYCQKEDYSPKKTVYAVYAVLDSSNANIGHVFEVHSKGYDSVIVMYVGIDNSGRIIGLYTPVIEETPGIGTKIKSESFTDQFISKETQLKPIYTTATNPDEITVISGATVSSKAVINGVNDALAAHRQLFGGENK